MEEKKCICGKIIIQPLGKRAKIYCSDKCRQKKWQQDRRDLLKHIEEYGNSVHKDENLPETNEKSETKQIEFASEIERMIFENTVNQLNKNKK